MSELWQRQLTHEEYVQHGDDWSRVGEGHCASCTHEGVLFRRPIDSPAMLSCSDCRDTIRKAYKQIIAGDEAKRRRE